MPMKDKLLDINYQVQDKITEVSRERVYVCVVTHAFSFGVSYFSLACFYFVCSSSANHGTSHFALLLYHVNTFVWVRFNNEENRENFIKTIYIFLPYLSFNLGELFGGHTVQLSCRL